MWIASTDQLCQIAAMTIVAAYRYIAGIRSDTALGIDGILTANNTKHSFDWVGLAEPSSEEMQLVQSQFGLHPLAVEDALNAHSLPKVETYGKQLFIIARTASITKADTIDYGQTAIFLGTNFIVTVRLGSVRDHSPLRERLEANPDRLSEGPDFVAHAILDYVVDGYQPIMDELENDVQAMEARAIDSFPEPATLRRIFHLRRQLRRFDRIVGPMEEVCERLSTTDLPAVDHSAQIWFRDVLDHMRRTMARLQGLKETLASIVETASLLEQHRQGEMTRQLAAWAAILAVPTAIAGIYGMNFDFIPELHWHYGYAFVWGLILTICSGLWLRFRQIGWL